MRRLMERIGDLEADGPKGRAGAGAGLPPASPNRSVTEAKVISNLQPLTDEKAAFRQWDAKLNNALAHLRPGYGRALDRLKHLIDQGDDLPQFGDVQLGSDPGRTEATSGPNLVDLLISTASRSDKETLNVAELDTDLSFTWSIRPR